MKIKRKKTAFTIVEITLVVSIIFGLIYALTFGTQAYLESADRTRCIQIMTTMQKNTDASFIAQGAESFEDLTLQHMHQALNSSAYFQNFDNVIIFSGTPYKIISITSSPTANTAQLCNDNNDNSNKNGTVYSIYYWTDMMILDWYMPIAGRKTNSMYSKSSIRCSGSEETASRKGFDIQEYAHSRKNNGW